MSPWTICLYTSANLFLWTSSPWVGLVWLAAAVLSNVFDMTSHPDDEAPVPSPAPSRRR